MMQAQPSSTQSKAGIELKRKTSSIIGNGAMKAKVPIIINFSKIS